MIHGFNDPQLTEEREAKEERRERRDTLIERFVPPEDQMWVYTQNKRTNEGSDDNGV